MIEQDCKRIKEIKKRVIEFNIDILSLTQDINSLSEILFNCSLDESASRSSNILVLAEILKEKSKNLMDNIESKELELANL